MEKIFNTDKRIKLGVFGLGRGGGLVGSASLLNIDVVAGCDKSEWLRNEFKRNVPGVFVTDDEDEFYKQDFDAVLIATFLPDHARHAIRALKAGKHVMCEVTAFFTPAEGVALVEAVEESGKVYHLLENYPFTKENMYIKDLWDKGFFGEFMYGEFEYVHCARQLSYVTNTGKGWYVHDWRTFLGAHIYCTHSLGPLMHITGLRPTEVVAFQDDVVLPGNFRVPRGGKTSAGASFVKMSNGGIMRNLKGPMTMDCHSGLRIWGTKAAANKMEKGHLKLAIGADGSGKVMEVTPEWVGLGTLAEKAGHGGGDFWELYFFAREILTGEKGPWNIYAACDVTLPGLLAQRSAFQGGKPIAIPDFRKKEDRDAYRFDTCEDFPRYTPDCAFPPDCDTELVKDFDNSMIKVFENGGLLQSLHTVLQGMEIYKYVTSDSDRLPIVSEAIRLRETLPELEKHCRILERIMDAYPDSNGGKTIRHGFNNIPKEKVYNVEDTLAEVDTWLKTVTK